MKRLPVRFAVPIACAALLFSACAGKPAPTSGSMHATPHRIASLAIADLARGDYGALCTYLLLGPGQQCNTGAPGTFTVTGYRVGHSVIIGNRALVVIEADQVCVFHTQCSSNHDPTAGLPGGSTTFDQAWQAAVSGGSFFTAALERSGGSWKIVALLKTG